MLHQAVCTAVTFPFLLAKEIVEAIEKCKNLKTLKLEGNTLGVDSAKAISKALEKHPEFEVYKCL